MDDSKVEDAEASLPQACRLTELESRYMHLQRTVDDLNEIVIGQSLRIESLERRLERMLGYVSALTARAAETGTPEDERPPHY